jgi:hypothetical protein
VGGLASVRKRGLSVGGGGVGGGGQVCVRVRFMGGGAQTAWRRPYVLRPVARRRGENRKHGRGAQVGVQECQRLVEDHVGQVVVRVHMLVVLCHAIVGKSVIVSLRFGDWSVCVCVCVCGGGGGGGGVAYNFRGGQLNIWGGEGGLQMLLPTRPCQFVHPGGDARDAPDAGVAVVIQVLARKGRLSTPRPRETWCTTVLSGPSWKSTEEQLVPTALPRHPLLLHVLGPR